MNRFTRWVRQIVGCDEQAAAPRHAEPTVDDKIQQIMDELAKCRKSQEETLAILDRRRSREPLPMGPIVGMSVGEVRDLLAKHGLSLTVVEAPKQ